VSACNGVDPVDDPVACTTNGRDYDGCFDIHLHSIGPACWVTSESDEIRRARPHQIRFITNLVLHHSKESLNLVVWHYTNIEKKNCVKMSTKTGMSIIMQDVCATNIEEQTTLQ